MSAAVITDTIVLDQTRPSTPVLIAVAGNKKVTLLWSAAVDPGGSASGVASYRIYRFDKGSATPLAVVTGTNALGFGRTQLQQVSWQEVAPCPEGQTPPC